MIVVNLITKKNGEIKRFLDKYFKEDAKIDNDVAEWIYVYKSTDSAIRIINAFLNTTEKFDLSLWVQIEDDELIAVKKNNYKKIIEKLNQINLNCNV